MSGFPWTSLLTAVVPAAAVLAGAALTGRQNNQAGRTAELKADYAAFVQGVTALIERLNDPRPAGDPGRGAEVPELVSAIASARALVDLAGSYGARKTASDVWQAALRATDAMYYRNWLDRNPHDSSQAGERIYAAADLALGELRAALEGFLRAVRAEVGGESRPGLKWIIKNALSRRRRYERPAEPGDDWPQPTL